MTEESKGTKRARLVLEEAERNRVQRTMREAAEAEAAKEQKGVMLAARKSKAEASAKAELEATAEARANRKKNPPSKLQRAIANANTVEELERRSIAADERNQRRDEKTIEQAAARQAGAIEMVRRRTAQQEADAKAASAEGARNEQHRIAARARAETRPTRIARRVAARKKSHSR